MISKLFFSISFILGVLFFVAPSRALAHFNEGKVHVHEEQILLPVIFVISLMFLATIIYKSRIFKKDSFRKDE